LLGFFLVWTTTATPASEQEGAPHLVQDVVASLAVLKVDQPGLLQQEVLRSGPDEAEVAVVLELDVLACWCIVQTMNVPG